MRNVDFIIDLIIAMLCGIREGKIESEDIVIFVLVESEGYSQAVVAQALGNSQSWVAKRLKRIKKFLRDELQAYVA
ncbi:MAG: hypothetical protein ABFE08_03095 [Armatimonadia bacterium]